MNILNKIYTWIIGEHIWSYFKHVICLLWSHMKGSGVISQPLTRTVLVWINQHYYFNFVDMLRLIVV